MFCVTFEPAVNKLKGTPLRKKAFLNSVNTDKNMFASNKKWVKKLLLRGFKYCVTDL